jgi:hypothetical protein
MPPETVQNRISPLSMIHWDFSAARGYPSLRHRILIVSVALGVNIAIFVRKLTYSLAARYSGSMKQFSTAYCLQLPLFET